MMAINGSRVRWRTSRSRVRNSIPRDCCSSVFTDLKRHYMGEFLNTDTLVQEGIPRHLWLTRKLWGFASEPPFLHHERATLISEAILAHGGEAGALRELWGGPDKGLPLLRNDASPASGLLEQRESGAIEYTTRFSGEW